MTMDPIIISRCGASVTSMTGSGGGKPTAAGSPPARTVPVAGALGSELVMCHHPGLAGAWHLLAQLYP